MRRECRPATLALAAAIEPGESSIAEDAAERIMDDAATGRGCTGPEALQEAIEKGVLSVSLTGKVTFPIPSFGDYARELSQR